MENLEERYLRWVMGLNNRTPGYMVRKELQRGKLKKRAWRFEKRLRERKGEKLARKCLEKMKERVAKEREISGWEEERRAFFESRGESGGGSGKRERKESGLLELNGKTWKSKEWKDEGKSTSRDTTDRIG